jgi:hypothetical protein
MFVITNWIFGNAFGIFCPFLFENIIEDILIR